MFSGPSQIIGSKRSGPMPHNGYRPFNAAGTYAAFPDFRYTTIAEGLATIHSKLEAKS
jgi:hypothetical protein